MSKYTVSEEVEGVFTVNREDEDTEKRVLVARVSDGLLHPATVAFAIADAMNAPRAKTAKKKGKRDKKRWAHEKSDVGHVIVHLKTSLRVATVTEDEDYDSFENDDVEGDGIDHIIDYLNAHFNLSDEDKGASRRCYIESITVYRVVERARLPSGTGFHRVIATFDDPTAAHALVATMNVHKKD